MPVASGGSDAYDPHMEARVARLEEDVRDVKAVLSRLEPIIVRMDAVITSTLPQLATKAEVADLRGEVHTGLSELRGEMQAGLSDVRGEVQAGVAEVRGELHTGLSDLRGEMQAGLSDVRGEVQAGVAEVRGELHTGLSDLRGELRAGLADKPSKTYLWGILGVLITAYAAGLAALAIVR